MKKFFVTMMIIIWIICSQLTVNAQNGVVTIGKTAKAPVIDGHLNDPCWNDCVEISNFIQYAGKQDPAREDTRVLITYDAQNLYLAFKCFESHLNPVLNQRHLFKVKVTREKNDSLEVFNDDSVEIFLTCDSEISSFYYQIAINSHGTIYDSDSSVGTKWNSGAIAKGNIGNDAWYLEAAIPLKNLSSTPIIPGKSIWRGNFCRNTKPVAETSSWNRATSKGFHAPEIFGELRFQKAVPGIRDITFSPFKNKKNSLSATVQNSSPEENVFSLALKMVFDDIEAVMNQETKTIGPTQHDIIKLDYYVDTSNMCAAYSFKNPVDPTVTIAKTELLDFKPGKEYLFKADVKSAYSRLSNQSYNFFLINSKNGYQPIKGAEAPLRTDGWVQINGLFKTENESKNMSLWLVKWTGAKIKGDLLLDNMKIIEKDTGRNLLSNGGFQNGPSGWPILQNMRKGYGYSAERMSYCYSFKTGERLLYRSPIYKKTLLKGNQRINSQMVDFGYTGVFRIEDLYLTAGAPEKLNLILKSDKADSLETVFFEIKMPYSCQLRFSGDNSNSAIPASVSEKVEKSENGKIRSYLMSFANEAISSSDDLPWEYVSIPLIISQTGWETDKTRGVIQYKAWINDQEKEKQYHNLKLVLLPPLSGKQPQKLPLIIWAYCAMEEFTSLSPGIRDLFIRKLADSGFNFACVPKALVDEYGDHNIKAFSLLPTVTIASDFPCTKKFVKEHPEFAAGYPSGKIADAIDPAYLLQEDCLFHEYMSKVFASYVNIYPDALNWDYEFPFMSKKHQRGKIGFSERNLKMFKKHAGIPEDEKLNAAIIYSRYQDKWIDFRCWQNAKIAGLYRKLIKKINPDCLFSFYSGYPPNSDNHYGVNWKYTSNEIDLPMCGYGGNNKLMLKTVKQKYFNAGLLLMSYTEQMPLENTIFNLLAEAGSYLTYVHFVIDGRFFLACSRAAAIASDFEDFFLNLKGNQHNELVTGKNGRPRNDVKVITRMDKRLILIFNYSPTEKDLKIHNKSLSPGIVGVDYDTKQLYQRPETMNLKVFPWRVKAIYLCPKQELSNGLTVPPVPKNNPDISCPILRWTDANSAIKKFEVKYGTAPDLKKATIIENIPDCFLQLPEKVQDCDKIYWQVRAVAVHGNSKSPWSNISCITFKRNYYSFQPAKAQKNGPFAKLGYWTKVSWGGGGPINILEKDYTTKYKGKYSLRCTNLFDNSHSYWTNYRHPGGSTKLPEIKEGEKYQLSAWIKTTGSDLNTRLLVDLLGEERQRIKSFKSSIKGTTDWKKTTLKFTVPKGGKRFRIIFGVDGEGTGWCGDIKLEKIKTD